MKKAVVNRYLAKNIENQPKPDAPEVLNVQERPVNSVESELRTEDEIVDLEKSGRVTKLECTDFQEDRQLTVTADSIGSEKFSDIEREREELKERLEKLELEQMVDEQRRDSLRIMEQSICGENAIVLSPSMKRVFKDVFVNDNEYLPWKLREIKRLKREREGQEAMKKDGRIIEKIQNFCDKNCGMSAKINPKMVGKYKFLQRYHRLHNNNKAPEAKARENLESKNVSRALGVRSFGRGGKTVFNEAMEDEKTPWIVYKYKIYN